jgi:hypothetical protein
VRKNLELQLQVTVKRICVFFFFFGNGKKLSNSHIKKERPLIFALHENIFGSRVNGELERKW